MLSNSSYMFSISVGRFTKFSVFQFLSEIITKVTSRKHTSSIVARMFI